MVVPKTEVQGITASDQSLVMKSLHNGNGLGNGGDVWSKAYEPSEE